ncbi:hypothetical protein NUW54_g13493 [Trametes sanguinea]|uniref:Uncharacterized protein n=1 Tax=Trametes sanguinea TaxID=158606 RepID=A0ACC1MKD6_9APHY|nr:hypothetical protein NUW54_g13493 [Trametes sanguinea]
MIPSGLSSPVTLAPRSARTSLPPELVMAALGDAANRPVDIDLTVDTDMDMGGPSSVGTQQSMDPTLGSSADRPIELELDIDVSYLGDEGAAGSNNNHQNLSGATGQQIKPKEEDNMDIDLLQALQTGAHSAAGDDLFASLGVTSSGDNTHGSAAASGPSSQNQPADAFSPGSFLASFGTGPSQTGDVSASNTATASGQDGQIEGFLNSGFFDDHTQNTTGDAEVDMMDIFNMAAVNPQSNTDNPAS